VDEISRTREMYRITTSVLSVIAYSITAHLCDGRLLLQHSVLRIRGGEIEEENEKLAFISPPTILSLSSINSSSQSEEETVGETSNVNVGDSLIHNTVHSLIKSDTLLLTKLTKLMRTLNNIKSKSGKYLVDSVAIKSKDIGTFVQKIRNSIQIDKHLNLDEYLKQMTGEAYKSLTTSSSIVCSFVLPLLLNFDDEILTNLAVLILALLGSSVGFQSFLYFVSVGYSVSIGCISALTLVVYNVSFVLMHSLSMSHDTIIYAQHSIYQLFSNCNIPLSLIQKIKSLLSQIFKYI